MVTMAGGALSLLAYGLLPNQPLALCGAFALGVMLSLNSIAVTSAIQLSTEADYRGRVNSLYNVVFKGGPALGAAFFGLVAELVDIRVSVVLAAILLPVMLSGILRISTLNSRSFERSDDNRDQ
jgi:MFS family permease